MNFYCRQLNRLIFGIIPVLIALPLIARAAAAEEKKEDASRTGTIEITCVEIKPDRGGDMVVALFRGEAGWLKPDGAFRKMTITADADTITLKFEDVPFDDSYAVQVFHDANRNGQLDFRRVIPIPVEGVGVSNNNERMGPPKYEKAEFAVDRAELTLRIIVRYY